jgi:hypothetical protein
MAGLDRTEMEVVYVAYLNNERYREESPAIPFVLSIWLTLSIC